MSALDVLYDKGSVSLTGLVLDQIYSSLQSLLKKDDEIMALLAYEAKKSDGYHSDTTSIHMVDKSATFRPTFNDRGRKTVVIAKGYESRYWTLHPLGVKPMTEEEYQELHRIGVI